jgi:type II secretory ATPase GspE/PulE/Tfp pilus assembly ATPase PilB-like protein
MIVTSKIKQAIHEARSTDEIRAVAIEQGMESLMDNARQIMLEGVTSLSEVFKLYAAEMFGE